MKKTEQLHDVYTLLATLSNFAAKVQKKRPHITELNTICKKTEELKIYVNEILDAEIDADEYNKACYKQYKILLGKFKNLKTELKLYKEIKTLKEELNFYKLQKNRYEEKIKDR